MTDHELPSAVMIEDLRARLARAERKADIAERCLQNACNGQGDFLGKLDQLLTWADVPSGPDGMKPLLDRVRLLIEDRDYWRIQAHLP